MVVEVSVEVTVVIDDILRHECAKHLFSVCAVIWT